MKTGWCLGPWPCAGRQRRRRGPRRARRRRRRRKRPRPQGDDLGGKLDRILKMLEASVKARKEKKPSGDTDRLGELLRRLEGEEAPVIPADRAGCREKTGDAALDMLRRVRPAVAAITDDGQRERVTDALLSCIPGEEVMQGLLGAARDSARKAAGSAPVSFEQMCEAQKAAYDARNPHKAKEVK